MLFCLTMGNTWKTLAWWLTIERQVKSWLQMRSETRVWRKKEHVEDKRQDERKERKHLNTYALYAPPPLSFPIWSHHAHLSSPLLPLSLTISKQQGFQTRCRAIASPASSPDSLDSRTGTWHQKWLWLQPLGCKTQHHMHSWKSTTPPITHQRSSCLG